jgi:FixJ family two-component response regulator
MAITIAYFEVMPAARRLIAVVDDEASVRRALERLLRASGIEVEAFATGQDFIDSLSTRQPDCVVLDLQMAGITGRDVQRNLAAAHIQIPIVIITAHDEALLREQCLADGAAAYLCKPLRGEKLLAAIERAIARHIK